MLGTQKYCIHIDEKLEGAEYLLVSARLYKAAALQCKYIEVFPQIFLRVAGIGISYCDSWSRRTRTVEGYRADAARNNQLRKVSVCIKCGDKVNWPFLASQISNSSVTTFKLFGTIGRPEKWFYQEGSIYHWSISYKNVKNIISCHHITIWFTLRIESLNHLNKSLNSNF